MAKPSWPRRYLRRPTPHEQGFRWPAEWEPHEATWLAWPHAEETWPGRLEEVERAFAAMAAAIGAGERVDVLVKSARVERSARAHLVRAGAERIRFLRVRTADAWIRDYGPLVLVRNDAAERERLALDFGFNAWGGKYEELCADDSVPRRLRRFTGIPTRRSRFVLEGGSIDGNGRGSALVTEQCLLHPNRNPDCARQDVEGLLRAALGLERLLWLGRGIAGDDTDGHVDDVARFVDARTVLAAVEPDPRDENHDALQENLGRLRAMRDARGRPLRVLELPMPAAVRASDGSRLPASYANFYVANRAVLVPVFGQPRDREALEVLGRCFPGRRIAPIEAEALVLGLGAVHCLTQQLPGAGRP